MKSIDICPFQLANELHAGLQELCAHEGFRFAENGVQLHARQASAFSDSATRDPDYGC